MTEHENSWVFDSLVCFLKGPIWDAPIQNFIEEKSLIFEPNNIENEDDYHRIFDEYKNLVDFMLGNFMEDIGITPSQFEYACFQSRQHHHSLRFDQSTFEQIWAANNYDMFKRMMTQRNVELQLQALELIERKYGIFPQSFVPSRWDTEIRMENQPKPDDTQNIERVILNEVAKKFVEEEPLEMPEVKSLLEEKEHLEITRDKISSEMTNTEVEIAIPHEGLVEVAGEHNSMKQGVVQEKKNGSSASSEDKLITPVVSSEPSGKIKKLPTSGKIEINKKKSSENIEMAISKSQNENQHEEVQTSFVETINVLPSNSRIEEKNPATSDSKSYVKNEIQDILSTGVKQIDQAELKKRQEYLRKQRDKLVALKREERRKQFGKTENENVIKKTRPKSAKAAQAVLTGEQSVLPSQELQLRRALAERLKLEVVDLNRK